MTKGKYVRTELDINKANRYVKNIKENLHQSQEKIKEFRKLSTLTRKKINDILPVIKGAHVLNILVDWNDELELNERVKLANRLILYVCEYPLLLELIEIKEVLQNTAKECLFDKKEKKKKMKEEQGRIFLERLFIEELIINFKKNGYKTINSTNLIKNMIDQNPQAGMSFGTFKTQYSHWLKSDEAHNARSAFYLGFDDEVNSEYKELLVKYNALKLNG